MTEQNNHTTDAPEGWDRYGEMLRAQPSPLPSEERVSAMMSRLDASIDRRAPRPRVPRWVLAPAIGVATLLVVLLVNILGGRGDGDRAASPSGASAPAASEAPRPQRRLHRRPLQAPEVSDAPEPMSIDTALPGVQVQPPYVDSTMPDPHPGPAPGSHTPGPSPGPRR